MSKKKVSPVDHEFHFWLRHGIDETSSLSPKKIKKAIDNRSLVDSDGNRVPSCFDLWEVGYGRALAAHALKKEWSEEKLTSANAKLQQRFLDDLKRNGLVVAAE